MRKWIQTLIPPDSWKLPVTITLGIFVGLGLYTIYVGNAGSYLSDDPKTCINCHVMYTQYATWSHSAHREVATCNDCHVPHDNFLHHYIFKAKDGLRHSTIFTLRKEPQVIQIKEAGQAVVQENCKRCHEFLNENVASLNVTMENHKTGEGNRCWDCHRETPHGRVNSLSATPWARVPRLESPVPKWLEKYTK